LLVSEFRQEAIMTAALYHEVDTVAPVRTLRLVRDTSPCERPAERPAPARAPKTVTRGMSFLLFVAGSDPLADAAARLLTVPVQHAYAALWRAGILEVGD
jgi:hypothetical protein